MLFKIGDKVQVKWAPDQSGKSLYAKDFYGKHGTVIKTGTHPNESEQFCHLDFLKDSNTAIYSKDLILINPIGVSSMLKSVGNDLKAFITEHKSVIYWIAVALLADHVFFGGAFREKLHGLMNKLLGKVEAQIDGSKTVTLVPEKQA